MMDKKLIIIIPNELETNIPPFNFICKKYHIEGLEKFVYLYDISLYDIRINNADKISKELADQNFCVINIDEFEDIKNFIIYLPDKISPKQLEYLKKIKEKIIDYEISILLRELTDNYKLIDKTTTNEPILKTLIDIATSQLIIPTKKKILSQNIK